MWQITPRSAHQHLGPKYWRIRVRYDIFLEQVHHQTFQNVLRLFQPLHPSDNFSGKSSDALILHQIKRLWWLHHLIPYFLPIATMLELDCSDNYFVSSAVSDSYAGDLGVLSALGFRGQALQVFIGWQVCIVCGTLMAPNMERSVVFCNMTAEDIPVRSFYVQSSPGLEKSQSFRLFWVHYSTWVMLFTEYMPYLMSKNWIMASGSSNVSKIFLTSQKF